jgi:hypothetical protein
MTQGHLTVCGRCGTIREEAPKQAEEEEEARWQTVNARTSPTRKYFSSSGGYAQCAGNK